MLDTAIVTRDVTWDEVDNHVREFVTYFKEKDITCVIGVGRGGLVPAVILSHQLGVPLVPIMWQNRDGEYKTSLNNIIEALNEGDTILVSDDVSDSGLTLSQVVGLINYVSHNLKKRINIYTCAVHQKRDSTFFTHKFGELVDNDVWLVYPWE